MNRDSPTEAAASASHHLHLPFHVSNSNQNVQTPPTDNWDSGRKIGPNYQGCFICLSQEAPCFSNITQRERQTYEMEQGPYWGKGKYGSRNSKSLIDFDPISKELRSLPPSSFCHVSLMSGSSGLVVDVQFNPQAMLPRKSL